MALTPTRFEVSNDGLSVSRLRCEDSTTLQLVETVVPRFSWRLESSTRGAEQTACQIRIHQLDSTGKPVGEPTETASIASCQSQWVMVPGFEATPQTRYHWQVRVQDNHGNDGGWSKLAEFETGLLGGPWQADWISDGRPVAMEEDPPARYLRREFSLPSAPVRARLYLSAFGLAEPWINGSRVSADYFLPGWPDYRKRNFYVSYDVTDQLTAGDNTVGIVLGDGWFSGTLFPKHQYDNIARTSAWIEITTADGETRSVKTNDSWKWEEGPIRAQGIYFGETYDARQELTGWAENGFDDTSWKSVVQVPATDLPLHARHSPPVRRIEERTPASVTEIEPGVFIYDMGQNMVGWVRLQLEAAAGKEITLRFAEMLDADGKLFTENLRTAEATGRYIAKGVEREIWEPSFTFFGFRYVELTGVKQPLDDAVTGVVVHSDLDRIGHFKCSDPMLNQLYSNTLWGQKGNFLELPTDCPQRDERLGWTGDAQVFAHTAHYNLRSGAFYRQWMAAVRDSFKPGERGGIGSVAPYIGLSHGAAGWADVIAIVPWITWLHTGDRRILAENFSTVRDWVDLQTGEAPDGIRVSKKGWGDWLAPGHAPKSAPTPYELIATAYYGYSTQLAARMAEVLDEPEIAREYWELWGKIKKAFNHKYVSADGRITSDEQTAYLLALNFDLVDDAQRPAMEQHLQRAVAEKDNHLSTGFLGTPLLTPVLSAIGRTDLAYTVLQQQTYPGWLFSVKNGATTIWERWDSWTPEIGFNPGGMNSFNHYAYGSVIGWFYDTIAGLKPLADYPGWKEFAIAPQPGGGLTYARASVETPHGLAACHWRKSPGKLEVKVSVPPNTCAKVTLPAAEADQVFSEGQPISEIRVISDLSSSSGYVRFRLSSGDYEFSIIASP